MKKYILLRTLRSLLSIFVVTALTYTIIYTMVPRRLIFRQDPNYNKIAKTADSKANYENTIYERMGYIDYYDTKELQEKASSLDKSVTTKPTKENKAIYQKYVDSLGHGWRLHQFKQSKQFYATRDVPVLERVFGFYTHLFEFDNTGWVIKFNCREIRFSFRFFKDRFKLFICQLFYRFLGFLFIHEYILL